MEAKRTQRNSNGTHPPVGRPLISIVVPTYNRAHTITRALDSILAQTYEHTELIVVDDGSSDNTVDVVGSYAASNFKFLRHSMNRGASAARNTGVKAASGSFLAFLDSDDEWLPEKLEHQFNQFSTDSDGSIKPDIVFCGVVGRKITPKRWPSDDVRSWITKGSGVVWSTMMLKCEAFLSIGGFDEQLVVSEWWDLVFRLSEMYKFALIRERLVTLHDPLGPRLWNSANREIASRAILKKYESNTLISRTYRSRSFIGIASRAMTANQPGEARAAAMSAMRAKPSFKALGLIVVSLLGDRFYRKCRLIWQKWWFSAIRRTIHR